MKVEKRKINQPSVFVIGDLDQSPRSVVKINEEIYDVESPLKAVDVCFKSFFVLDAQFPTESEYCYLYLQEYVYKIPKEKNLPNCVTSLHSDILLEKQKYLTSSK